jgi:hypothetical protein
MSETCKMKDAGQRGVCGKKAVTSFSIGPGPMSPTDYLATTMQVPVCADHANVVTTAVPVRTRPLEVDASRPPPPLPSRCGNGGRGIIAVPPEAGR